MKIEAALTHFLTENTFSPRTETLYTYVITRFIKETGKELVKDLTKESVGTYFNKSVSKLAPSSQKQALAIFKTFNKHLLAYDLIDEMFTLRVKTAQVNKDIRKNKNIGGADLILSTLDKIDNSQDKVIISVAVLSGLRISEIQNLTWGDINFQEDYIHVRNGKGNKDRLVMLSPTLKKQLYLLASETDNTSSNRPLLISTQGIKMSVKTISRRIKKWLDCNPHSCRTTFATNLIKNGCDIETVRSNMGHSSILSTQIYVDLAQEESTKKAMQYSI